VYPVQPTLGRRSLIAASAVVGAAAVSGCAPDERVPPTTSTAHPAQEPASHQPGVTTSPPAFAALASFDVEGSGLGLLFDRLGQRIDRIQAAG
jgi:hypothetical protein